MNAPTATVPSSISISQELNSAWQDSSGRKLTLWGAIGFLVLTQFILGIVHYALFGSPETAGAVGQIVNILFGLVSGAIGVGVFIIAIEFARGNSPKATSVFDTMGGIVSISLCSILMMILIVIGLVLLILPGIYLAVSYMFALPLVYDKKLGVWDALETSRKTVTANWFSYFFLFLLMSIIMVISAIPLFIGLIWTVPMSYTMYGRLYHKAFDS